MRKETALQTIEVRYAFTGWRRETGWFSEMENGDAMFDNGSGRTHLPACNWRHVRHSDNDLIHDRHARDLAMEKPVTVTEADTSAWLKSAGF